MNELKIRTKIAITVGGVAILSIIFGILIILEVGNAREIALLLKTEYIEYETYSVYNGYELSDLAEIHRSINIIALAFVISLPLFCAIAGVILSNNISKPLKFFAKCFTGIADTGNIFLDDYSYKQTKILNRRKDDIGVISCSVGDMLAMFREKIKWLNAVKDGDLVTTVQNRSNHDTVGAAMENMVEGLNQMLGEIRNVSLKVTSGAFNLDSGAKSLAEASCEQSQAIEWVTNTIHDVAEHSFKKNEIASRSAKLAREIKSLAENSRSQMDEMTDAVEQIKEAGAAIGKVIKVIDDIAFQTNLLALNASVEAARAGQHGKGFAVVAQEVRMLASKSSEAAGETEELISDSINKSNIGANIAQRASTSLEEIVEGISKNVDLSEEISTLADNQAKTIDTINKYIDEINETVKKSNQTAIDSAKESKEVSRQSELLRESLQRFKIN
ncbi:MAG: methyl-accepting chemotaxis protein [Oscillospiraceae bacterium]|nr:methyl-accepting chemotaxis protein [Oscillospiraceae bacterium]